MKGDLRARLERLKKTGELTGAAAPAAVPPPSAAFLFPEEERLEETPCGPCYFREQSFPLDFRHGGEALAGILNCRGADLVLPAGDRSLQRFNPAEALFMDLETTGLAGGTGTWAFLIGTGWLEGGRFRLRQYFLRKPAEEKAMLGHFQEFMARFPGLVTFNGRVFDLPLIHSRQILARLTPVQPQYHLDLLPCSRRLWKERLLSCSLRSLEENLLAYTRSGDIPGAEIPSIYFNYLRRGETRRLKEVFRHNTLDILSMVTLLAKVAATAAGHGIEHPAECLALGRLHAANGNEEAAAHYYRQAAACNGWTESALWRLSLLYKKRRAWEQAVFCWQLLVHKHPHNLLPYVELAKYYEHRRKDIAAALDFTRRALERCLPAAVAEKAALRHRLHRLERKAGGAGHKVIRL